MKKWSPSTRKFHVAVRPIKLEELPDDVAADNDTAASEHRLVAVETRWKGEPRIFPSLSRRRQNNNLSTQEKLEKGCGLVEWDEGQWFENTCGLVEWDEGQWFENTCCLSVVSNHHQQLKFGAWEVAFSVLYGEEKKKMGVVGRVSVNIGELVGEVQNSSLEKKLPLSLKMKGIERDATLTVGFSFVEMRESQDSWSMAPELNNMKARRRSLSQEEANLHELDAAETTTLRTGKKEGWFPWKRRHLTFKRTKTRQDKLEDRPESSNNESETEENSAGEWEEKEFTSRDGKTKLRAPVFFASFDQRSHRAAGESACTALVAVISHWLHSNADSMPSKAQLNDLIIQGSSEWRKLCQDAAYADDYANKHFDLETVFRADIRPMSISHDKSFVGFFGAEKFEALKGAMQFDDIWNEICSSAAPDSIFIVSWNDHFFVLKADANACYIIDTLGERLLEGCNQAYIIRFDESASMRMQERDETWESGECEENGIICSGKDCCGEFIKRFLAAIPLKELEEEESRKAVPYFSLHQRLQIEFNYTCLASATSSLASSPLSTQTHSSTSSFS